MWRRWDWDLTQHGIAGIPVDKRPVFEAWKKKIISIFATRNRLTLFNFIHYFNYQNDACNLQIIFHASEYNFFSMGWDPHNRYKIADSFCSSFYEPCLTKYLPLLSSFFILKCTENFDMYVDTLWKNCTEKYVQLISTTAHICPTFYPYEPPFKIYFLLLFLFLRKETYIIKFFCATYVRRGTYFRSILKTCKGGANSHSIFYYIICAIFKFTVSTVPLYRWTKRSTIAFLYTGLF